MFWLEDYLGTHMKNTFVGTVLFQEFFITTDAAMETRFAEFLFEE